MEHSLKTWPHEHGAVKSGAKTFEVRSNTDRSFGVGDTLLLRRWDPEARYTPSCSPGCYIDPKGITREMPLQADTVRVRVTYILHGGRFGLPPGLCVMGIAPQDTERGSAPGGEK